MLSYENLLVARFPRVTGEHFFLTGLIPVPNVKNKYP
jgi:hypothetical protein